VRAITPRTLYNRPGLPAIDYRAGTHAGFLESMIARLASRPELGGYTTRDPGDPGIALLDCWALIADIVTFYAERAANEGYLSTATRSASLTMLGRLVNYQPRPALGASGYLAFTMDPGAAGVIPAGTQARSVAGPGQLPQTFETSEAISARADWNQLEVRLTQPAVLSSDTADDHDQLTVVGTSIGVQTGARLVLDFPIPVPVLPGQKVSSQVRVVTAVAPDFTTSRTVVSLVPVGDAGTLKAIEELKSSIKKTMGESPSLSGPIAAGVYNTLHEAENLDLTQLAHVADLIRELTEWQAVAANRVPPEVAGWLAGAVTDVVSTAQTALRLIAHDNRQLDPEIAYLQLLAQKLTCPENKTSSGVTAADAGSGDDGECDRAASLAAAAAILPALRRPPSQPPATPTALTQTASTALDPQSAAVTALLTAADPRLAGVLPQAIGKQTVTPPPATAGVTALTTKASVPDPLDQGVATTELILDGTPSSLVPGGWFVTEQRDNPPDLFVNRIVSVERFTQLLKLATASAATPEATTTPPPAAPATYVPRTKVTLDGDAWSGDGSYPFYDLTVYFGDSPLQLADEPITSDVVGAQIDLAQTYDGLYPGQRIVITGERTDIPGTPGITASELSMVGGVTQRLNTALGGDATLPVLTLATNLAYTYKRDTVTINGNVARATQGESWPEVLGSGAAGQPGQAFAVKHVTATSPLTWLPSDNALGAADTLTVRVNGVRWHESDDLAQAGPNDTVYRLVAASDGTLTARFGDGVHGSRLPTGQQNVTATGRTGAGSGGNLDAGRVSQLASRPLGVNAVTNPLPTTGGADGDGPADMRANTPLRCLALDRLLSAQDYADFTAARAGIGKAAAATLTDGSRQVIYVTIAGVDDAPVDVSDLLVTDLLAALAELGDPYLPVRVGVRDLLLLVMSAGIHVGADYSYDLVEPAVRAAALAVGGFAAHGLGQTVYLSEIVAAMQAVPGVDYVDVDLFGALPGTADPVQLLTSLIGLSTATSSVEPVIDVKPARFEQVTYIANDPSDLDPTGQPDTLTSIAVRKGTTVGALAALNPQLTDIVLTKGTQLTIASGIRPAQLAMFHPDVPQTLLLRSIP
jgi:predicted phage baseplate assembly protein